MRTTPCASERLHAVQMLSSNYQMLPTPKGNVVVNFTNVREAAELADEYGLKLCLLDQRNERIKLDKYHINDVAKKYDLHSYIVAVSD